MEVASEKLAWGLHSHGLLSVSILQWYSARQKTDFTPVGFYMQIFNYNACRNFALKRIDWRKHGELVSTLNGLRSCHSSSVRKAMVRGDGFLQMWNDARKEWVCSMRNQRTKQEFPEGQYEVTHKAEPKKLRDQASGWKTLRAPSQLSKSDILNRQNQDSSNKKFGGGLFRIYTRDTKLYLAAHQELYWKALDRTNPRRWSNRHLIIVLKALLFKSAEGRSCHMLQVLRRLFPTVCKWASILEMFLSFFSYAYSKTYTASLS